MKDLSNTGFEMEKGIIYKKNFDVIFAVKSLRESLRFVDLIHNESN